MANFVEHYLSARHRDEPGRGCPMASLSGDIARLPVAARKRFTIGATRLTNSIGELLGKLGHADGEALATSLVAEMVGALALSRAVIDPVQSDRILEASRDAIKARIGPAQPRKRAKR